MRRAPDSLQYVVVAATRATAMSSSPFRGGRNQWRRGSSNRPYSGSGRGQYVTGDSHIRSVRDANIGFRQGDPGSFSNQAGHPPPPPPFSQNNQFRRAPPSDHNQPYRPHQQFRPPQQFGPAQPHRSRPQKPLDYRNWEYAKSTLPPDSDKFKVLSYNILADYLANDHRSKLYYHIPRHMMDWQWRKKNLIFELGLWSADVMCLQEVDRFQELEEELKLRGYSGIWKMRTGNPVDGCAVFWRPSRFKLLHEECIEFNKLGLRDNVAQICVLELLRQTSKKSNAALPASSPISNKVVICNIHALYNPRRGEIKLGQVRVLLDKACAVSKFWNDAPIVLCGDFNCTPKSPLYNFISEQKLDLSEVDRDKVSGQASAEIGAPRSYNPNYRGQHAINFVPGSPMVEGKEPDIKQNDLTSYLQNPNNPESSVEDAQLANNGSQPQLNDTSDIFGKSCIDVHYEKDGVGHDDSNVCGEKESMNFTKLSSTRDNVTARKGCDPYYVDSLNSEIPLSEVSGQTSFADAIQGPPLDNLGHLPSKEISVVEKDNASAQYQVNISCASTSVDLEVQKNAENLSIFELEEAIPEGGNTAEDDSTFLSALHNSGDGFASDFASAPPNDTLPASTDRVEDGLSLELDSETVGVETTYDPSLWTPMEIETATGNAECTLLEHPLKLRSTYTEAEDCAGTRDSNGEPLVTSYNRCFLGTVDYIWRTEGLQTVSVLAPIPKHAMQWTSGFPTRKWGSDHIALASEFVFTKSSDQP